MPNQEIVELRNRILGVLIRGVRERMRLSRKECASVLGISEDQFARYEEGESPISLPELELLARYFEVPLQAFRDTDSLEPEDDSSELPDPHLFLPLRHRIVGARLRKTRLEAGRTPQDLADVLECSDSVISSYEYGLEPIPLAELEILARSLTVPLDAFMDRDSEVGVWHQLREQFKQFAELPVEIREFVLRPINKSYLELAMKLADMPAGALRQIAEGLLEITF
jgi:transcriptional regulator with XRE-family HTH domain